MPVPEVVDPDAELRCERLGSTCDLTTASPEELALGGEVSRELATAMAEQDKACSRARCRHRRPLAVQLDLRRW